MTTYDDACACRCGGSHVRGRRSDADAGACRGYRLSCVVNSFGGAYGGGDDRNNITLRRWWSYYGGGGSCGYFGDGDKGCRGQREDFGAVNDRDGGD